MAYRASYGADTYGSALYGVTGAINGSTDVTFRPNYGALTYGTAVYGTQGNETATLATTCSAQVLVNGSATVSTALTSVSSGKKVRNASAIAALQSATISIAEEYVATTGYRPGYGLRTYGTSIYGQNNSIEESTASTSASLSTSFSFVRKQKGAATSSLALSTTARGVYSIKASAAIIASLSISASFQRILNGSATATVSLSSSASAIEKWEPIAATPETWSPVAAASETWTPITFSRAA